MNSLLLIDTDVMIDYFRERPQAIHFLESLTNPVLFSALTFAELYAGVREGKERNALDEFFLESEVIPLDKIIAKQGGLYRLTFWKSHGTSIIDALIAATVQLNHAQLVTLNRKHFPMLDDVLVP